ncbi:MAG TPA: metal-dependent transcriptional regulator [Caldisericia bacterium]|jgi:DtxR family Mn-dependent transcriptional regulator|nr:metal-dependent transcriptional regulator [Caldisericia bacterium]HXK51415.1 metal-dependent transcriptional regulator [Caldisericia bacterium]
MKKKQISTSQEDYLEAILRIFNEKKGVRTKDIATMLEVRNSSVTSALKHLSNEGLIHYEKYGVISLTEEGEKMANYIWIRHQIIYFFFHHLLKIPHYQSKLIACQSEHAVTGLAFSRLLHYIQEHHPNELDQYIQDRNINPVYLQYYLDDCSDQESE